MSSKAIRDQQALKAPLGQSDYKVPRVMLVTLGLMDAKAVEASQEKLEKMEKDEKAEKERKKPAEGGSIVPPDSSLLNVWQPLSLW